MWALWGERYKKSMRLQKTEGVQWDTRHDFTGLSLDEPEGERFPLYLAFVCTGGGTPSSIEAVNPELHGRRMHALMAQQGAVWGDSPISDIVISIRRNKKSVLRPSIQRR